MQINAEKSPFLVEKLKIWMLPTLALIKKEKVMDYVVGFDDFGGYGGGCEKRTAWGASFRVKSVPFLQVDLKHHYMHFLKALFNFVQLLNWMGVLPRVWCLSF